MDSKVFSKIVNILPNSFKARCSPLCVSDSSLMVSDGIIMVKYSTEELKDIQLSLSYDDFVYIKKNIQNDVKITDKLYLTDEICFNNTNDLLLYNTFCNIYNNMKKFNILPYADKTVKNCKYVIFNKNGVVFASEEHEILDGISMSIKFDDFPYIICQYKYYKQIIDLYRYFGLVPTMKFNSRKIIVFENEFLTCILATYLTDDPKWNDATYASMSDW